MVKCVVVAMAMAAGVVGGLSPTSPASAQEVPEGLLPPGDWLPEEEQYMLDLIEEAEAKLAPFSNESELTSMGFVNIGVTAPGGWEHYVSVPAMTDEYVLDFDHPESLVFRNGQLVAAMMFLDLGTTMEDVPEDLTWLPGWHTHPELCSDNQGRIVGFTTPGTNNCPPGSGPAIGPPMMHVWIVDNDCGHRFGGVGVGGLHCDDYGTPGGSGGGSGGYPYGQDITAELSGSVSIDNVETGFGPAGTVEFPTGGEGVCNPEGTATTLAGSVSQNQEGSASVTGVTTSAQPADLVVTDDGAICGSVTLNAGGGAIQGEEGTFTLTDVTADLEITGTGVFEPLIPAGCSLTLDVGELTGDIAGDGPPSAATLAASGASVAEAPDGCGAYGLLLDVGFELPSPNSEVALDLNVDWEGGGGGGEHDMDHDH